MFCLLASRVLILQIYKFWNWRSSTKSRSWSIWQTRSIRRLNEDLEVGRRIGWDGTWRLWELGTLCRVRYTDAARTESVDHDPDAFNRGIAPATKLLYAVVARIAELEPNSATPFLESWRIWRSPVHVRLWSEHDLNTLLVPPEEVGEFLIYLDDRQFWDLHSFPEIAELRSRRFAEFDSISQNAILARLRKGPPRHHWPRNADPDEVKDARLYWAVRGTQSSSGCRRNPARRDAVMGAVDDSTVWRSFHNDGWGRLSRRPTHRFHRSA